MKKNRKIAGVVASICIILALGIMCFRNDNKQSDTIKIGAIVPLTGAVASDGEEAVIGMQIAVDELNQREGENRFKLILKDGKFEPKESLNAYQLLVSENVDAIMAVGDVSCQIIEPFLSKDKIVAMAPMSASLQSINQSDWIFRSWMSIKNSAQILATYVGQEGKAKKVGIFHIDTMYGIESADAFSQTFKNYGGVISRTDTFPFLASDLKSNILKLLQDSPDAIYVTGFGPTYVVAINQIRELNYNGLLILDAAVVDPRVRKNIKDLSNVIFVGMAFEDELISARNKASQAFLTDYQRRTGRGIKEMPPQAPFSYLAVKIAAESLVKNRNGESVRSTISAMKNEDSLLGSFSFGKDGELSIPMYVMRFDANNNPMIIEREIWKKVQ